MYEKPIPAKVKVCSYECCALPIGCDTYRNCANNCLYCYEKQSSNQHLRTKQVQPRDHLMLFDSLYKEREVSFFVKDKPVALRIGMLSDPFPDIEKDCRATARFLKLLGRAGFQVQLTTKKPENITAEHIELLKACDKAMIRVSFSLFDDDKCSILESGAISPTRRLQEIKRLTDAGIECGIRLSPYIHTHKYDFARMAASGISNITMGFFRFSGLWRHSTDPTLWEIISGEANPDHTGNVKDKSSLIRQWVEAKEKEFFAHLKTPDTRYFGSKNLWISIDVYKARMAIQQVRSIVKNLGLQFGVCSDGGNIHNIDLTDAPCGCLTEGWLYDDGALAPEWHKDNWARYRLPVAHDYRYDLWIDRFMAANTEFLRPIAFDDNPEIYREAVLDVPILGNIGTDKNGIP